MPSGKPSRRRGSSLGGSTIPWGAIIASLIVVLFAAGVVGYVMMEQKKKTAEQDAVSAFTPSPTNHDPAKAIPGVVVAEFEGGQHVKPTDRVAYKHSPPFGGAHDFSWAACTGVVYPKPVRNENMVHALEHGSVWIAYNPDQVNGDALTSLKTLVEGQPYTLMSPYPGLDQPISLQAWGHQLKLADAADPRVKEFIQALRENQYTPPEPGASCDALGPGLFDQDNPPPFNATPPGKDAVPEAGRPGAPPAAGTMPGR